jgi:hypothetical protein
VGDFLFSKVGWVKPYSSSRCKPGARFSRAIPHFVLA